MQGIPETGPALTRDLFPVAPFPSFPPQIQLWQQILVLTFPSSQIATSDAEIACWWLICTLCIITRSGDPSVTDLTDVSCLGRHS